MLLHTNYHGLLLALIVVGSITNPAAVADKAEKIDLDPRWDEFLHLENSPVLDVANFNPPVSSEQATVVVVYSHKCPYSKKFKWVWDEMLGLGGGKKEEAEEHSPNSDDSKDHRANNRVDDDGAGGGDSKAEKRSDSRRPAIRYYEVDCIQPGNEQFCAEQTDEGYPTLIAYAYGKKEEFTRGDDVPELQTNMNKKLDKMRPSGLVDRVKYIYHKITA
ncbi:hypothetical protein BJ085DRAFT_37794 [Dimargaris cristalligena]|uniref:Thioredoxin-like protein n=1 Tax=Dimargaris cristalligena TaxID=215637 RepID=A0A4P9ZQ86_9FUNG|nr:hypothetical protein BJ085DRAFT_37794 [Dimargaris cristalligena]|eukprot:RKP35497.1 hypothetical protein BJ085DRAFT_37794 [Dimargaris cristalligena]